MSVMKLRRFEGDKRTEVHCADFEELRHIALLLAEDRERYESVVLEDLTKDKRGRPWAKLSEIKAGDLLEPDAGFTCMRPDLLYMCLLNDAGDLYIECGDGHHVLCGQADDGEHVVGLYRAHLS